MRTTILGILAGLFILAPAAASMDYYLVAQWLDRGDRFCRYSDGTVLNVGVSTCPLKIRG